MDISPSVLYQAVRRDIERSRYGSAVEETDLDGALRNLDRNTDLGYVASLRLLSSITKKMAPPKASSEAKEAAISLFLQCNADNLKWKPPIPDTWEDAVFSEMKRIAYRELGELPDWQALLENADVGPGAVVGSRGKNSFLEKIFVNRTTTTSLSLYAEWLRFLSKKDTWLAAEICRQNSSLIFLEVVRGDTLSTVRKNTGIDRTIGSAPSLNMLFQKSLSAHIEQVLRSCYGYSPKIQPDRNRRMALKGSRDGSRADRKSVV